MMKLPNYHSSELEVKKLRLNKIYKHVFLQISVVSTTILHDKNFNCFNCETCLQIISHHAFVEPVEHIHLKMRFCHAIIQKENVNFLQNNK